MEHWSINPPLGAHFYVAGSCPDLLCNYFSFCPHLVSRGHVHLLNFPSDQIHIKDAPWHPCPRTEAQRYSQSYFLRLSCSPAYKASWESNPWIYDLLESLLFFFFFNWRIIALQYYCMGFCHTMWIRHNYIYIYLLPLEPPSPLPSHLSRLSQNARLGSLCYTAASLLHQIHLLVYQSRMIDWFCCYFWLPWVFVAAWRLFIVELWWVGLVAPRCVGS